MSRRDANLLVPAGAFAVAIALSVFCGPALRATALRAPQDPSGGKNIAIVSIDAKLEIAAGFALVQGNANTLSVTQPKVCYQVCPCNSVDLLLTPSIEVDLHFECTDVGGKKSPRKVTFQVPIGAPVSFKGDPGSTETKTICPDHSGQSWTISGAQAKGTFDAVLAAIKSSQEFEECELKKEPDVSAQFKFSLSTAVKCVEDPSKADLKTANEQVAVAAIKNKPLIKPISFKGKGCEKM